MIRVPIIHRVSIFPRHSIYPRVSIYHRKPIYPVLSKFRTCELCYGNKDCYNNQYGKNQDFNVIRVYENTYNYDEVMKKIQKSKTSKKSLRFIVDFSIDEKVLWAASYGDKNVLQINVNLYKKDLSWISKLSHVSSKCGMLVMLFFFPIVPNRIMVHHLLRVVNMVKNLAHQYVMVKFAESQSLLLHCDDWYNVNGTVIPANYLSAEGEHWECSQLFIDEFMKIVREYTEPRGIKTFVCGEGDKCLLTK